jgi:hypothetical protein
MKNVLSGLVCSLIVVAGFCRAEELEPGLLGEYFGLSEEVSDFPTIAADKKPSVKKIDKTINVESTEEGFNGTNLTDQFYIRWTGTLKVAKDGKYRFYTESDDGSRLFIDGKQVVDNGGQHAMEEKSGDVELKAGDHEIKLEFFENGGGAGCKLSWETDGVGKQIIPETALMHKKGAENN